MHIHVSKLPSELLLLRKVWLALIVLQDLFRAVLSSSNYQTTHIYIVQALSIYTDKVNTDTIGMRMIQHIVI